MTMGWKYAKPIKEKLITLEEPGKALPFDADRGLVEEVMAQCDIMALDRGLVEEVMAQCDIMALVESLKGKGEKAAGEALESFGRELMKLTIELTDGKYIDRTGEMVERVATQTGISFPHRLERYVELSILSSRPTHRQGYHQGAGTPGLQLCPEPGTGGGRTRPPLQSDVPCQLRGCRCQDRRQIERGDEQDADQGWHV